MQTPHLTDGQVSRYRAQTLAPGELLPVTDHLAACEACRRRLLAGYGPEIGLASLRRQLDRHLEYAEVAAAAEGHGDAMAALHLKRCEMCHAEVEDLRRFRLQIQAAERRPEVTAIRGRLWRRPVWAAAAAVTLAAGLAFWWNARTPAVRQEMSTAVPAEAPLSAEQQKLLSAVADTGELPRAPVLDRLIRKRGVLLGAGDEKGFELLSPVGTVALDERPEFRWKEVEGASGYSVAIFDEEFRQVAASGVVTFSHWRPEAALPRGRTFSWQVTAMVRGRKLRAPTPPAPEARFQVAEAEVVERISLAGREHPGRALLLAVLAAEAGALDEAGRYLNRLTGPDADLAARLRASLRRLRQP